MSGSLRWRLSGWIAAITLVTGIVAGACSFYLAFDEAQELQDDQLRQMALMLDQFDEEVKQWGGASNSGDNNHETRIVIIPLGSEKTSNKNSYPFPLPRVTSSLPDGFQTIDGDVESWRLYVRTLSSGQRIAVGQRTYVRNEQAWDSGQYTLIPILLLVPTLLVLIAWIIKRTLSPVTFLATQLDTRDDQNLTPLPDTGLPREIEPFVASLNRLMCRLDKAIEYQRHFIANAAHELRSPLTALTVQAANLRNTALSSEGQDRISALQAGLARTGALLEQLLSMARHQVTSNTSEDVDFARLIRRGIEEVMPMAAAKSIDLGCERLESVHLRTSDAEIAILIRNVLDNAIRYTPSGGVVDVSLYREDGRIVFQVEDTGPGIPTGEEERLFEPFYRVMGNDQTGSGLGLAIVRRIADRLGGTTTLENREHGRGAVFRYTHQTSGTGSGIRIESNSHKHFGEKGAKSGN